MYVFYEKCFVRNDEINKLQPKKLQQSVISTVLYNKKCGEIRVLSMEQQKPVKGLFHKAR